MRRSAAPITESDFATDVVAGLTRKGQKQIAAKYLYDDIGSALFDVITLLPEYGLTRADLRLLKAHAAELSDLIQPSIVVELGSGGGGKARLLLREFASRQEDVVYCPIDVSASALERCVHELAGIEGLRIKPIEALYHRGLRAALEERPADAPALILFLGSSLGNFSAPEREGLLKDIRRQVRAGDLFLLSTDLQKDRPRMLAAYDDAIGATAAFNLNLLARMNRELGTDFDTSRFVHEVRYDERHHRIEMHLRSTANQVVSIGAAPLGFRQGETIWTESSYKFRCDDIRRLARKSGFRCLTQWVDEEWPFAQSLLRAI